MNAQDARNLMPNGPRPIPKYLERKIARAAKRGEGWLELRWSEVDDFQLLKDLKDAGFRIGINVNGNRKIFWEMPAFDSWSES